MPKGEPPLRALARSAANLNNISDELASVLSEVEDRLAQAFAIEGWVEIKTEPYYDENGNQMGDVTFSVGFDRFNRDWTILLRRNWTDGDENTEPLRDSSRELRIAAANKLPDLVTQIADKAAAMVSDATNALANAKSMLELLPEGDPSKRRRSTEITDDDIPF